MRIFGLLNTLSLTIMRKILFLLAITLTVPAFSQSMKIVCKKNGEVLGRLIEEKKDTYIICTQYDYEIPKAGTKIEIYRAEDGDGIVILNYDGPDKVLIHAKPSEKSKTLECNTEIDWFWDCLGKVNGWYKIRLWDEKGESTGYIHEKYVIWDGLDTI